MKPDDMAGPLAAPDASPLAAVLVSAGLPPRGEESSRVACDALFELQQGDPLVCQAADGGARTGIAQRQPMAGRG
jgi:hypothetical protein